MTTYDFVHLVLLAAGGRMQGRTKLQKTVYFVGALTGQLAGLGYRPHYYGPFSPEVAAAVDELRGLGFLRQQVLSLGSVDDQGFERSRYDYELTEEGKLVADEKSKGEADIWKQLQFAISVLNKANADDYVKLSVAAKSYFLNQQNKGAISAEDKASQTSMYGWKVTADQFREADRFLESIGLGSAVTTR